MTEELRPGHPPTIFATIDGETRPVREWCRMRKISLQAVYKRISRGWSPEEAVTLPIQRYHRQAKL